MDKAALAAPAAGDGGIFGLYGEKRKISLCVSEKDANGNEVPRSEERRVGKECGS